MAMSKVNVIETDSLVIGAGSISVFFVDTLA